MHKCTIVKTSLQNRLQAGCLDADLTDEGLRDALDTDLQILTRKSLNDRDSPQLDWMGSGARRLPDD